MQNATTKTSEEVIIKDVGHISLINQSSRGHARELAVLAAAELERLKMGRAAIITYTRACD